MSENQFQAEMSDFGNRCRVHVNANIYCDTFSEAQDYIHLFTLAYQGRNMSNDMLSLLKELGAKITYPEELTKNISPELMPDKPNKLPETEEKPAGVDMRHLPPQRNGGKSRRSSKYGIPTELYTSDRKKYKRIWARCKKHGITYEEALKLETKPEDPKEEPVENPIPDKTEVPSDDIITRNFPALTDPLAIIQGHTVLMIKPNGDKQIVPGNLLITSRKIDGRIEVRDNNGKLHLIPPDCLKVIL
jgi:hypothetical protein